jgi:hypothetical protein
MSKKDSERRATNRIELPKTFIQYKLAGNKFLFKNFSNPFELINISKSGLSFTLPENVGYGDPLQVKINFPDGKRFNLKGKVRWISDNEVHAQKVGVLFEPFGNQKKYNPISALEYLRSMKDQAIERRHNTDKSELPS